MIATFERCDNPDSSPGQATDVGASWRAELEAELQQRASDQYGVPIQEQGIPVILHGSYAHLCVLRGSTNEVNPDGK